MNIKIKVWILLMLMLLFMSLACWDDGDKSNYYTPEPPCCISDDYTPEPTANYGVW